MAAPSSSGHRPKKTMMTPMKWQRLQPGSTVCQSKRAACWDTTMVPVTSSPMKSVMTRPQRKVRKEDRAWELPCRALTSTLNASRLEARPTRQKEAANQGEAIRRRSSSVMFVGRKQGPRELPLGHMAPERSGEGHHPIRPRLQVGRTGTGSGTPGEGGGGREDLLVIHSAF